MYMESLKGSHTWTEISVKSLENLHKKRFYWKIKSAKETSEIVLNLVNLQLHPTYHKINTGMPNYGYQGNVKNFLLTVHSDSYSLKSMKNRKS